MRDYNPNIEVTQAGIRGLSALILLPPTNVTVKTITEDQGEIRREKKVQLLSDIVNSFHLPIAKKKN